MVAKTKSSKHAKGVDSNNSNSKSLSRPKPEEYFSRGKDCKNKSSCSDCGGIIYLLGFVGAVVYHVSVASGFWNGVLGVLKALAWPAIVVFKLLLM